MSYEYFSNTTSASSLAEPLRFAIESEPRYEVLSFSPQLIRLRFSASEIFPKWPESARIILETSYVCVQVHGGSKADGDALLDCVNKVLSKFGAPALAEED